MNDEIVLNSIAQALFDKKARNVIALDLREVSSLTDYFIIAEGTVDRHVRALEFAVKDCLEEQFGLRPFHEEGQRVGDWVVLDYGSFIVHLFIPELREKYALEELWKESRIVDVVIDTKRSEV
jgi:ribosome-associated protein